MYTLNHKAIPKRDLQKIKAVIWIFYTNIALKNNKYVVLCQKGSDSNLSESLFTLYK